MGRGSAGIRPAAPVLPSPAMGPECAAGGSRRTHRGLPQVGPIRMADGAPKNSKNRWGACAAGNSPTDAVTTADISLTVRAYDHAGLGSPPPEHLGVRSGVGMPSPALLLLSLAAFTISKRGCGCWGDRVAAGPARKPAKSRPLQCCASTGERGVGQIIGSRVVLIETATRLSAPHPRHLTRIATVGQLGRGAQPELQQDRWCQQRVMAGGAAHEP